jgi:hypothetical protein
MELMEHSIHQAEHAIKQYMHLVLICVGKYYIIIIKIFDIFLANFFFFKQTRSYSFEYLEDRKINDIPVYAYHLPKNIFYNSTVSNNPNFCGERECLGNGVMNISACYGGVSGFISLPHFLNAESKFVDDLEGLKPDEKLHDFVFNFEPVSLTILTFFLKYIKNYKL